MSSIDKLLLYGIRSFGPEDKDKARIKFSSPLTLILGHNGCGKTTIIEALKFATCGELPPGTDNGSGFVHDPKLSGLIETRGQVKLRCIDTRGKGITVTRSVQVTQKAKRLEFKTLDSTCTGDDGNSISGRCNDTDATMCYSLGVSKAILNNVIFCHQEDSGWPLEKGKKMKEKFDAIFGITDYNKCLDHIRALKKEMSTEKIMAEKDLTASAICRDEARSKQKSLEDFSAKLASSRDNVATFERQIEPLQNKVEEIEKKELNLVKYYTDMEHCKNKRELLIETQKEIRRNISSEFKGSQQELKEHIHSFHAQLREQENSLGSYEEEKRTLSQNELKLQKQIETEQITLGKLVQNNEQNMIRKQTRNSIITKLIKDLDLSIIFEKDVSEAERLEILSSIKEKIDECSRDEKRLQEEQEELEKSLQVKIDKLREERATLEHDVKAKKKQIDNNIKEIRSVKAEIEQVDKSATTLANLEARLERVNKDIDEITSSLNVDDMKQEIQRNTEKRNRLEDTLVAIDREVKTLQLLSIDRAELERLNERKQNRFSEIKKLKDKHEQSLQHLFGTVPDHGLRLQLQSCLEKLERDISNRQKTISDKSRELTTLNVNKEHLAKKLKSQQRALSQDEETIFDICDGDEDFDSYLARLTNQIRDTQDQKGTCSASEFLFRRYVQKLQSEESVCPLCHRGFDNSSDVSELVDDLNKKIRDMPSRLNKMISDLDAMLEKQSRLQQLKPTYDNLSKLRSIEIPALKADLEKVDNKIKALTLDIERENSDLLSPLTDQSLVKSMQSDIILIEQHQLEVKKIEQEIVRLEAKLPASASSKTLNEAMLEQDELKSEITDVRKNLENQQYKLSNYSDKVRQLHERKNSIVAEQLKVEGGVQQRKTLADKLVELQALDGVLHLELEQSTDQLKPMSQELNSALEELSETKRSHKTLLDKERKKVTEYNHQMSDLSKVQSLIDRYEKEGGEKKLSVTRQEVAKLMVRRDNLQEERKTIEGKLDNVNRIINNKKSEELNLENNLKLMRKKEEELKVAEEITRLQGCLGNVDIHNLTKEKEKFRKQLETLRGQKARAQGRQDELQNSVADLNEELNKPIYKNAEQAYRKDAIAVKVKAKVVDDLNQYYLAMDWAMIHFHKERMKMINTIVRDLWRQIYCGNDIDTIEIRTDETNATGADRRRTYNYRVVQMKNGTELDMPGRCSAGQKVLACLIIRMALAETFSKNCGILALDEPTTNLDRDNIKSLSAALAEIVNTRMVQKNFQLIVITHDEDFLSKLTSVDKVQHYLKVQRNSKGKSEVRTIPIS